HHRVRQPLRELDLLYVACHQELFYFQFDHFIHFYPVMPPLLLHRPHSEVDIQLVLDNFSLDTSQLLRRVCKHIHEFPYHTNQPRSHWLPQFFPDSKLFLFTPLDHLDFLHFASWLNLLRPQILPFELSGSLLFPGLQIDSSPHRHNLSPIKTIQGCSHRLQLHIQLPIYLHEAIIKHDIDRASRVYKYTFYIETCNFCRNHQGIIMRYHHPCCILCPKTNFWYSGRDTHLLSFPLHRSNMTLPSIIRVSVCRSSRNHIYRASLHLVSLSLSLSFSASSPPLPLISLSTISTTSRILLIIFITSLHRLFPTPPILLPPHLILINELLEMPCSDKALYFVFEMSTILNSMAIILVEATISPRFRLCWPFKPRPRP
ncbi:Unknown protein, partial [Striga hermonthica]